MKNIKAKLKASGAVLLLLTIITVLTIILQYAANHSAIFQFIVITFVLVGFISVVAIVWSEFYDLFK